MSEQVTHYASYGRLIADDGAHPAAEVPGKQRFGLESDGGCDVVYLASPPPLGSWIGVRGEWFQLDLGPAPGGGTAVELQVHATGWDPLPEGFHPGLDGDLQEWIDEFGWGSWT